MSLEKVQFRCRLAGLIYPLRDSDSLHFLSLEPHSVVCQMVISWSIHDSKFWSCLEALSNHVMSDQDLIFAQLFWDILQTRLGYSRRRWVILRWKWGSTVVKKSHSPVFGSKVKALHTQSSSRRCKINIAQSDLPRLALSSSRITSSYSKQIHCTYCKTLAVLIASHYHLRVGAKLTSHNRICQD